MNILIAGASGLIGTALSLHFKQAGHHVYPLIRGDESHPFSWRPEKQSINLNPDIALDVVINLAGPSVADKRWTERRKSEILQSRIMATTLLSNTLINLDHPPQLFVSASAIGFYGPRDDSVVDEKTENGTGFLAEVSRQWETATENAEAAGIRTVCTRFGIVLSTDGGALAKMLTPFKLGLGGVIGSGQQYMSWISLNDVVGAIDFLLSNKQVSGPINLVSPNPVTNYEFTRTLGKVLSRPTVLPMPTWLCRLMFGEMANEILLTGAKVMPTRLTEVGYSFKDANLDQALSSLLK